MNFVRSNLKANRVAVFFALVIGVIYVSHNFFIQDILSKSGDLYFPVTPGHNYDEALYYGPRAQSAYLGSILIGDISTYEYQKSPAFLPLLNPLLLGYLGRILGSLKAGFVASDFLFPAFIYLAVYFLIFEITKRRPLALFCSAIFMFIPHVGLILSSFSRSSSKDLIYSFLPWLHTENALPFLRFEYPKLTYLFYALAILFIYRALKLNRRRDQILGGIFFGLLFYTYFFDWVSILISLIIMTLTFLFIKKYSEFKKTFSIVIIGIFVSIPYWLNFLKLHKLPQYPDIFLRLGVEISNQFRFSFVWTSYIRIILMVLILVMFWWRKNSNLVIFLTSLLVTYFIVLNVQVITGFNLQPDHWYRTQFMPVFLALIMIGVWLFEKYFSKYRTLIFIASGIIVIFLLVGTLYGQKIFSVVHAERYIVPQAVFASYEWLNHNTEKSSVVGTLSASTNNDILLHTHNKIFLISGLNTIASIDEIWKRLFILGKLFNLTSEKWGELAITSNTYLFTDYYRDHSFNSYFKSDAIREIPKSVLEEKIEGYKKASNVNIMKDLQYRLDYLYLGPQEASLGIDLDRSLSGLQEVYNRDKIRIYKL